jgi:hypothetical protein
MLGNSLKTYTKFMKPIMFANGTNVSKNIRYFASKNANDNSVTLWIINHASSASSISVIISNFPSQTQGDVWKLTSASDSPTASDNSLTQAGSVTAAVSGGTATFSVNINATSVTVVTFSGTVLPPNVLPTCSLTAPTNNQSIITTDNVTLSATASDSDGSISQVEFFIDEISKGSDNTSPYSVVVNGLTAGSHTVYAKAIDNRGGVTKSSTVTINVTAAPKYALTVTNGTGTGSYEANKVVPIVANAAASGNEFDKWTGATSNIANVNSASTTVIMPTSAITITATYKVLLIDTTVNVALNKTASQVSTYIGAEASSVMST